MFKFIALVSLLTVASAQNYNVGAGFQANNLGLNVNNLGLDPNELGLTQNELGLSANNLGLSANNLGLTQNNLGLAQNNLGLTQNTLGLAQNNIRFNAHAAGAAGPAPAVTDNPEIQAYHNDVHAEGFQYGFATSNGIAASAAGDQAGNHQGSFSWTSPEGQQVRIDYIADENGYRASGDALPTPPPIPDAILRSLEYIRTHPSQESRQGLSQQQFFNAAQQQPSQQFLGQDQFKK